MLVKKTNRVLEDEKREYAKLAGAREHDTGIRKVAAKLLPYGSARREGLKRILGISTIN